MPLENPPQTDLRIVFFFWGCAPCPCCCVTAFFMQNSTHPYPVRGSSQGGIAADFTSSPPNASLATSHPTAAPCPCLLVVFHSGTAPLHCFTTKACRPSGYLMAPASHNSHSSHNSYNSYNAPANVAMHTADAITNLDNHPRHT